MLVAWVRVELMMEWTVSQSGECVHKGRGRQRERGRERQTDDWTDRRVGRERDTVVRTEIVLEGRAGKGSSEHPGTSLLSYPVTPPPLRV